MLVSIITVCFNCEKTIRHTIESVLQQDYKDIEYLIIDGCSKDNTLSIVKEYEDKFAEKGYIYKIISEKDQGIYDAMNKGIRLATGEVIGLINSDDWYEPNAVSTAAEVYKKEQYDMFYADINLIKNDGSVIVKHSRLDRFPTSRHWNHPTTFITQKTYNEFGVYRNEGIHDDFDLVLRIRKAGKKVVVKNVVLANFRAGGASNEKELKKCIKRCKDRYACYKNNGYSKLYLLECVAMEIAKFLCV